MPRPAASTSRAGHPRKSSRSRARCCCPCCSSSSRCCLRRQLNGSGARWPSSRRSRATPPTSPAACSAWRRSRSSPGSSCPPSSGSALPFAAAALPLITTAEPDGRGRRAADSLDWPRHRAARRQPGPHAPDGRADANWSPYYRITVFQAGAETVVEVNNIFHQSMAPVEHKEYFYQWPYTVFGDTFDNVLILGAGTGTDVAAALRHGAQARGRRRNRSRSSCASAAQRHPDHPYSRSARHGHQRRRASLPADDDARSTTSWCSR